MTKQILSKQVRDYIVSNPRSVLLDVRTEEEWNSLRKKINENQKVSLALYTREDHQLDFQIQGVA